MPLLSVVLSMTERGRGSTGLGRRASLPPQGYEAAEAAPGALGGLDVLFDGEDERSTTFAVADFPLPGWHPAVADALRRVLGPLGSIRTLGSAKSYVRSVRQALLVLSGLTDPPSSPRSLTIAHLESMYDHHRGRGLHESRAWSRVAEFGRFLSVSPLVEQVAQDVIDHTCRRVGIQYRGGRPGYSDGELTRLLAAARTDVAAIRDRIRTAESLVSAHEQASGSLADGRYEALTLADMARSGVVPRPPGIDGEFRVTRRALASQLFLTIPDLAPLMALLVAVTGRNVETIKELPHEHRILESRAVEVRLVKRRRRGRWFDTATWDIGPPGKELDYPGGLYLLLHELTGRSRTFSDSTSVWSLWRNGHLRGLQGVEEHYDPFARDLSALAIRWTVWRDRHHLEADALEGAEPEPLEVSTNRIKTSTEVRRTKQLGGHLPSSARSNTVPVLFGNYLRGDPTVAEWAQDIVATAVSEAESKALQAHRRALQIAGGALHVRSPASGPEDDDMPAPHPAAEAAWTTCIDADSHPATGNTCRASFLDCFHCGNCVITPDHLPGLLGLLDALVARRQQLPEADWWRKYGPTWAAIHHDVLPKFSRSEITVAARNKATDSLLDLVETPWETA
ncbi:hypothetical protein [Microbispora sp. NRRL B-24597]|uniref:hypothetical protein n=2 Tax=Actinomycetota TaxID=201174 RepID=UPI0018CC2113|nr:hypothetical protein [Microbispora sp. NRRL B-24597]